MGVQRNADAFPVLHVAAEPLDLVGVNVGGGPLHGRGQIEDDRLLRGRLPHVHDRLANLQRKLKLGVGERLRRILQVDVGSRHGGDQFLHHPGSIHRDLPDVPATGIVESHPALQRRSGVIHVHDGILHAIERLEGATDQVLAGLHQDLHLNLIRNPFLLHQPAQEIELGIGGRGKPDLDLPEPHSHEKLEHLQLLFHAHGDGQGLVAIPEINRTPDGCLGYSAVRPLPIRKADLGEEPVLSDVLGVHRSVRWC